MRLRASVIAQAGVALAALALTPAPLQAAGPTGATVQQAEELAVGIRVVPPFVIDQGDGTYSGLTIQLWEHVADELELEHRFEERDIQGLLDGVEDGSLAAAAAALTITSEREETVDFTHPFFVTGLGIAVPHRPAGLGQALLALFSPDFLWVVLLLAALLLGWGVLLWIFERKANAEEFGGTPAEGIGSGFWWAAVTMTTVGYGDKAPRTLGGRVVGFVWMFAAIVVISFFTASIASSLTVNRLDTRVSGPQDLPFVRVGALEESAAFEHLAEDGIGAEAYATIEAGLAAAAEGEIDAFVHDAPILRFHVREEFQGRARVLPGTFVEQYYGIALPRGSDRRTPINQVLLDYLQTEEWERLNTRYLGEE